jgi:alkyl sulfatase BDS1-like metallo-beta-lactamase superfamily hydrolase
MLGETTFEEAIKAGQVTIDGNAQKLTELLSLLDSFEPMFNIVTP